MSRSHRITPRLEELPSRYLLACDVVTTLGGAWDGGNLLTITDGNDDETISIRDNGSAAAGHLSVTCDGLIYDTAGLYSEIRVRGNGGRDTVYYTLTDDLVDDRRLDVRLGSGADFFRANLYNNALVGSDIEADASLDLRVYGNSGDDTIRVRANRDTDVRTGAGLFMTLSGGGNTDTIDIRCNGEVDGALNFVANGNTGNDNVNAYVTLDAGSTGRLGHQDSAARVRGGDNEDTLAFLVQNDGDADVFAEIHGDAGLDDLSFTDNVDLFW